ncbi:glycosyltransferase family 4 protein [Microbacterium rhizomatis]|uniref:Glycosyltransferase family 4 protein n=1 Tax=Microbacterium rhizomatis TaxID=1631477 RepID=A0A5J5IZQ8_9MICO|nr:glycosyltransferase family 4 protein [Microbacterium rhizomatis]KAA9107791.1 glycosyltransferase family 4 protein [Microbacterium rhizomatis]
MRIAVVSLHYAPEPTGNAPYVADLVNGLASAGHDVTVITSQPFYPGWQRYKGYGPGRSATNDSGVNVIRLRHYIPARPTALKRLISELTAGAAAFVEGLHGADAAIFVSPAMFHAALASRRLSWRPKRSRAPWVVWVQDLYTLGVKETGTAGGRAAAAISRVESSMLRGADRVVSIHERFTRFVIDSLGVSDAKVATIRNWSHIQASAADPADRDSLGWRRDEYVVLHAGNQGLKQGLANVVEAAKIAERRALPIRFVLLGDGNQRETLEKMGQGVSTIQFLDPLPDELFFSTLTAADALLVNELPDVREMSVPSKLTSYFATGLPVIASTHRDSVTAEEIERSGGGVVVDGGNPDELVRMIVELSRDPHRSAALGAAGLRYRQEQLGRDVAITKFLALLDGMRSGPRDGSSRVTAPPTQQTRDHG